MSGSSALGFRNTCRAGARVSDGKTTNGDQDDPLTLLLMACQAYALSCGPLF